MQRPNSPHRTVRGPEGTEPRRNADADAYKKQEIYDIYCNALQELTFNSKPIITKLTMLAEKYSAFAPVIARAVSDHWNSVRLDAIYLYANIYFLGSSTFKIAVPLFN